MDAGFDAGPPHLPCDVEAVLRAKCRACHSNPPTNGAPFPLVTQDDFLAPYFSKSVRETAITAISTDYMPLNGPPLPANEKELMLGWLDAGVPVVTGTCP